MAMDFDPTLKTLRSEEVEAYLMKCGVHLPSNIKVEWCPLDTEYIKAPKAWWSVYFHPQVLALWLTFPITSFVRDILRYYHVAPSQLVAGGWCVVLSFQALCNMYFPDAYRVEDFSALYTMKKTKQEVLASLLRNPVE